MWGLSSTNLGCVCLAVVWMRRNESCEGGRSTIALVLGARAGPDALRCACLLALCDRILQKRRDVPM